MKKLGFSASNSDDRNFDIFLDYLANCSENDMDQIDPHFRLQFYNVRPDLISYDFWGELRAWIMILNILWKNLENVVLILISLRLDVKMYLKVVIHQLKAKFESWRPYFLKITTYLSNFL